MGRVEASAAPTAPESSAEPPEATGTPETSPEGASEPERERGEDGRLLSREAARYRTQLRETQAERDSLREQLDRVQRADVERMASSAGLAVASDVWQFGATLETLRDDAGAIDAEAVGGLVEAIIRDRPGLKAPTVGDIGIGRGNAAAGPQPDKVGLSALLKP